MGVQYCNSNQPTLGLNKTNIVKRDFNIIKVIWSTLIKKGRGALHQIKMMEIKIQERKKMTELSY